jgi:hypothetical protein
MAAIIIKGSLAAPQDRNVPLEVLQQLCKTINFTTGTIEVLIPPQFFRRFFFVVII